MKKFLRSVWGIVCSIAVLLLLLGGAAFGGYQYWLYRQPKFHDLTVELGAENIPVSAFFTQYARPEKAAFVTEPELTRTGQFPVVLRHGSREETVTLTVVDTTAPVVSFREKRIEPVGYVPAPEDFVEQVTDLSEVKLFFMEMPELPEDYRDVELTVVVEDIHGNRVAQTCVVSYAWMYSQVTLELGEELTPAHILLEPEKDADMLDAEMLAQISSAGPGQYTLTCASGDRSMECTVTVVDTTAPLLELQSVNIYDNGHAELEDFVIRAEDVSGPVELKLLTQLQFGTLGEYPVRIEATDVNGNKVIGETTLCVVKDTTGPSISGLSAMTVEKYSSPDYLTGVTAYDKRDGSCQVTCDASDVDLTRAGTYYVVYTAVDRSGNTGSAQRKVVVKHDSADRAALVASIAQQVGSDPEKLRDFVREEIEYISNWGGDDPVWYGFTQWVGNCYVHAVCLQALLDYYGYETRMIWVEDHSHYWLIINLNGTWWHIDATPGPVHTIYSLMNDQQRLETLRGRKWDTTQWPPCG